MDSSNLFGPDVVTSAESPNRSNGKLAPPNNYQRSPHHLHQQQQHQLNHHHQHHYNHGHSSIKPFRSHDSSIKMHSYLLSNGHNNSHNNINSSINFGHNNHHSNLNNNNTQRVELPLRILVPTSTMGAIIGKGGVTIKQIIAETMTRIDVHRNHGQVPQEKIVSIYGNASNCSRALTKIMEIVRNEEGAAKKSDVEVPLRILAHNAHVGRVIGKSGATINAIMKETNTRVGVSNISWNYSQFLTERVITINGSLPDQIRAEQQISDILRMVYAKEMLNSLPMTNPTNVNLHHNMNGGNSSTHHPYSSSHNSNGGSGNTNSNSTNINEHHLGRNASLAGNNPTQMYFAGAGHPQMSMPFVDPVYGQQPFLAEPYSTPANHMTASHNIAAVQLLGPLVTHALGGISMAVTRISALDKKKELAYVHVPQSAVGPIIGTKGSTIQKVIQRSGANLIKILANSERNKNGSATTNESKGKLNCPETNESEGQTLSPDTTTDSLDSETSKKNESPDSVVENPTQDQSGDVEQLSESLQRQANLSAEEGHKVTIFGTPEAQAIAQYLIFRIAANSEPDGVFKVEIHIPTAQAGRIIGRNGYTVKELQLYTNARIKIGDDNLPVGEETPVYITGDYLSTQTAQRQIRALVNKAIYDSNWKNKLQSTSNEVESPKDNLTNELPAESLETCAPLSLEDEINRSNNEQSIKCDV